MKAGQSPALLLPHEDQRRAELVLKLMVLVPPLYSFATCCYSRIPVDARLRIIPPKGLVSQNPGLVPRQPLILGQDKAARPYANKIVGQSSFEEGGVAAQLGGGPVLPEFLQLLSSIFQGSSPLVGLFIHISLRRRTGAVMTTPPR